MHASFKKLIILALFASVGLVFLQGFWLLHEWKRDREVVQRQATTALKDAVSKEIELRRDSLRRYLNAVLNDTNLFTFSTIYLPKYKVWSIKMSDAANPNDYVNWSNKNIPVGPVLSDSEKQQVIQSMISTNIDRNVVMYYTQRLGNSWKSRFDSLCLNEPLLLSLFKKELEAVNLFSSFDLSFIDTASHSNPGPATKNRIETQMIGIQYKSVWDNDNNFVAIASIKNPFILLLKRLWFTIAATLLLVMLTLYCMYQLHRVIRRQKKLAAIKNDFISNITHELQTPLATIGAAIDALQYFEGIDDKGKRERYLNASRAELERLSRYITQIMNMALYENTSLQLNKEWIYLESVFNETVRTLSVQYGFDLDYTITDTASVKKVFADKNQFLIAVKNILENAVKYHSRQSEVKLDISVSKAGNDIIIQVKDNGPGIASEHHPHLFDKFYRVPQGDRHDIKGFGLGLYYVRKIMIAHNGNVSIQSRENGGTTVSIQIPIADELN